MERLIALNQSEVLLNLCKIQKNGPSIIWESKGFGWLMAGAITSANLKKTEWLELNILIVADAGS